MKKSYEKVEKSESMRMDIRSKKARKLVEETLKVVDSPKSKTFAFWCLIIPQKIQPLIISYIKLLNFKLSLSFNKFHQEPL